MDKHNLDHTFNSQVGIGEGGNLSPLATGGLNLRMYRLVPVAADDDPNWLGATEHDELVVCALSSGDARVVAAERELDFLEIDAAPAEDVTTVNASMYRNDKLYTVIDDGAASPGIERGVIDGIVRVDNIMPTQTE